jgi:ubiquinone biosynthesis protein
MAIRRAFVVDRPPQATLHGTVRRLGDFLTVLRKRKVNEGLTPEKLRLVFEDLGPTFVKLGQMMSLRSDILPQEYCNELVQLRMNVRPVPWEEIEPFLVSTYGKPLDEVFSEIDDVPMGSASIAQVYRGTLLDGSEVAIKVQRPGIGESMTRDISMMRRAVDALDLVSPSTATGMVDLPAVVDELWSTFQREMDFLQEMDSLEEFTRNNASISYVTCPRVYKRYCTSRVLVMEFIDGIPIDHIDALCAAGYDLPDIGGKLAENYTKQILDDGFFHVDPHPGNLLVRDGAIVWIDLGMMGRFNTQERRQFRSLISALVAGDTSSVKDMLLTIGSAEGEIDHAGLLTDIDTMIERYGSTNLEDLDLGTALGDLFELVRHFGIRLPANYVMLGRGYVTLETVIASCKPEQSTLQIMASHLKSEFIRDFDLGKELSHLLVSGGRSMEKAVDLPAHVSDLVNMAAKGQVKVNMAVTGSEEPIRLLGAIIDRTGVALISSGLFIGSSILCMTSMKPQVIGIPLLGLLGYLGALVLSMWFIYKVVLRRHHR